MRTDVQISEALERLINDIETPPAPLTEIHRAVARPEPEPVRERTSRPLRVAIAVGAASAVIAVVSTSSFVQGVEQAIDRYRAALEAKGGWAPPTPPDKLWKAIMQQSSSAQNEPLGTAQTHVSFAIVPPAGLPRDVVSAAIYTVPTLEYSTSLQTWQLGPHIAWFVYRRANGKTFVILAKPFDPREGTPSKYIFEADEDHPGPNGRLTLLKHDVFTWKNGNQVITAIDGSVISAREIEAIRTAMDGIPIPGRWPDRPQPGELDIAVAAPPGM
ncbi:MAG TPA: hypothetical protein VID24_11020 [Candidatus Eremiobacteraceae bacterium]|jgi:hypothetical protein